jgi:hypothetical protein
VQEDHNNKRCFPQTIDTIAGEVNSGVPLAAQAINAVGLIAPIRCQATWTARDTRCVEADDIVQGSLLVLLGRDSQSRYEGSRAPATAYARGIARNIARNMQRKARRYAQLPEGIDRPVTGPGPFDEAIRSECRSALVAAIASLPPRFRGAIYEKYGDFGTGDKIRFPARPRYFAIDLHRAHARLRGLLREQGLNFQQML